ncbi:MAG: ATP-dependent DNA helicase RecQ [Candidatus Latescibacterota bacterium]|nr:ATP-dependent DNA helicase RecQ [Candidatus Latescibacterota bacterium]
MITNADRVDLEAGLQRLGFADFRPGQREAIEALLEVGRVLLVAPTGGGKSLTYQLPAALLPGTTLVVSPLIALMHDQVTALEARGVPATYLAGTLDGDVIRQRMGAMARGEYKLVYVAPERLTFDGFRDLVGKLDCPLVAIDEAHCISEWGHDFRPEYMQIGKLLERLPQARVLACTATATPVVRDEILERLGLPPDTPQQLRGFARPNLAFRVLETQSKRDREANVDSALQETLGTPGSGRGTAIIYAPTRRQTEEEAGRLHGAGWNAAGYHAGMEGFQREAVQRAFMAGQQEIVVATNAFGMGIDRADVRCIAHLAPPSSVEAYYQEAGRAGRDGADAVCILLVSPGDMALRRRLIESDVDGRAPDAETVRHRWNLFLELMRYAEGGGCRHDAILRYFGDEAETLAGCGKCDVCLELSDDDGYDADEVGRLVRQALCGVARVHGRFGIGAAARLLRGADDLRLQRAGLDQTPTYGVLSEKGEEWILTLLRRCVTAGWVDFSGGDRPVVLVTDEGYDVIHERRPVRLLLPPADAGRRKAPKGARRSGKKRLAPVPSDLDALGGRIFGDLRAWRLETARAEGKPPYVVASDRTLRDIATLRPADIDALQQAHGIGPAKVEKFGEDILRVVREAQATSVDS